MTFRNIFLKINLLILAVILCAGYSACRCNRAVEEEPQDVVQKSLKKPEKRLTLEEEEFLSDVKKSLSEGEKSKNATLSDDVLNDKISEKPLNQTLNELIKLNLLQDSDKIVQLLNAVRNYGPEAAPVIVAMLDKSKLTNEKVMLIYALGAIDDSSATRRLYEIVKKGMGSLQEQEAAIDGIASKRTKEGIEFIFAIFRNDPKLRNKAASSLGELNDKEVFQLFADLVRSDTADQYLKSAAIKALAYDESAGTREYLLKLIKDINTPREIRNEAIAALGKSGAQEQIAELVELMITNKSAGLNHQLLPIVKKDGDVVAGVVEKHLKTAQTNMEKINLINMLEKTASKDSVGVLEQYYLNNPDEAENIQRIIIRAIGKSKTKEASTFLKQIVLESTKDSLKAEAMNGLSLIGGPDTLSFAENILTTDNDFRLKIKAVAILSAQGNSKNIAVLESVKESNSDPRLERYINSAIQTIGIRESKKKK